MLYQAGIQNIKLSEESTYTLYQFSKSEYLSTYQVQRLLMNTKYKSEYKNVYKKVQNLLSLKLIEKIPRNLNNIEHGAIYYKLTSSGIFYLLSNPNSFDYETLDIVKNFGDDPFFTLFIYPYFKHETLYNLRLGKIIFDVYKLFTRISKIIKELVEDIDSIDKNKGIFVITGTWDLISTDKRNVLKNEWGTFILTLKKHTKLKWIDEDVKVNKLDNHTFTFEKGNHIIQLKLDESKTNLIISSNNKELYRFMVHKHNKSLLIIELMPQTVESEMNYRLKRFDKRIPEMIEDLAVSLVKYSVPLRYPTSNEEIERIEDIKTLSKDENFVKIVKIVEKKYKEYFENFMKEVKIETKA